MWFQQASRRPQGSPCLPSVILSTAKDLSLGRAQILSGAKDDNSAEVHASGVAPTIYELRVPNSLVWYDHSDPDVW
jgi:hypothetical protein